MNPNEHKQITKDYASLRNKKDNFKQYTFYK